MQIPDPWPLRTSRLLLRHVREADLDRMIAIRRQPEVNRWLLRNTIDPDSFRRNWLSTVEDPRDHSVVVELDGDVIGTGSLDVLDGMGQDGGAPPVGSEASIGYILDPDHAGRGYGTEVAEALLSAAFEVLGLRRVTAGCFAANTASWRVMEKLGMRREQHSIKDAWHAELGWIDGYTYAILAEEWQARPAAPTEP